MGSVGVEKKWEREKDDSLEDCNGVGGPTDVGPTSFGFSSTGVGV